MPFRRTCRSALLLGALPLVHAQIYKLDGLAVPANQSMQFLYAFYVYSYNDAPAKHEGHPFVQYADLVAHSESPAATQDGGLQLSIIKYQDFWAFLDPAKPCSAKEPGRVYLKPPDPANPTAQAEIYKHTVRFRPAMAADAEEDKFVFQVSGVYILVFSNCGQITEATADGKVVVKNAYGYLPGNEYHKMPFYGFIAFVYLCSVLVWATLSLRWWQELFPLQNCIFGVLLLGLFECFVCYMCLRNWNATGERSKLLFVISILLGVLKSAFSYMLVLVASLGWGVTKPFLDEQAVFKIKVVSSVYIGLNFIREAVLSFRHSHALSLVFVLLCLLPVSILNGIIFYWVFMGLSQIMESLEERRQHEKLMLFQRLWRILIVALVVATFTLLYHIFSLARSITTRWRIEWLFTDGVSHLIFLGVLCAMMFLLAPHKSSQRYAYSQAPDAETQGAIWADEDLEEEAEDQEDFWAQTLEVNTTTTTTTTTTTGQGEPEPTVVGAAAEDDKVGAEPEA